MTAFIDDLEAIADWKADLASRIRRAELRFEFAAISDLQRLAEEQDHLTDEVEDFKAVSRGLAQIMQGDAV